MMMNDDQTVTVKQKGIETIVSASLQRKDDLHKKIENVSTITVHQSCRKNYTRPSSIINSNRSEMPSSSSTSRSTRTKFDFKTHCLFCTNNAVYDLKLPTDRREAIAIVHTLKIQNTIVDTCNTRKDDWGYAVKTRILSLSDLVAAEGRYHIKCYKKFQKLPSDQDKGRKPCDKKEKAFQEICSFLENSDDSQYSVQELEDITKKKLDDENEEPYSAKYLKKRLREFFGERLFIFTSGKKTICCLSDNAGRVMYDWYKDVKKNEHDDARMKIVLKAATIMKEDIQKKVYDKSVYPSVDDIKTSGIDLVPDTLKAFMNNLVRKKNSSETNDKKCTVINHDII